MPIIVEPIIAAGDAVVLGPVQRVLRGVSATLGYSFTTDGTVIDPGTATVSITTSDGVMIVTDGIASEPSPGLFTYTLTPSQTSVLGTFTVAWAATIGGQPQRIAELIEVAGGFVYSLADARATTGLNAKDNTGNYRISTASLLETRTEVERALEHELGFAMVPRYKTETVDGPGGNAFMLSQPYIRRVRSVTIGNAVLDVGAAALAFTPSGRLYYPGGWAAGYGNVTVGYDHGLDMPPPGAKQAALALTRRWLTGSAADDRATSMSTDEQTTTFYVPGESEPFDVPAANRFVASHTLRVGLA